MNVERLSKRLSAVSNFIPEGAKLADIGSDHAYLPCHVVKAGKVPYAIAGEVVEGPFQSARKQVEMEGLTKQIDVRKGNGLEVIGVGEVDCITIAGMGGALIATILEEGKEKLKGVKRLVLQPNISAISIRLWLLGNGWSLIDEAILEEDGKIYEILVAEKGDPKSVYTEKMENQLLFGPYLSKEKNEAFIDKWTAEWNNWDRILKQMSQSSQTTEKIEKKMEIQKKISMVKEVLGE
ncbi:tRNA (adenine(22)-N(1))-methyltransferase TrmK [Robertmurraya korlensis]|uniref:tRNA (adenine(22)-N(1))-methyltransferase n=1 Tax=Robertmurraya korlensis TaxID=519977 RepID=UPI00203DEAA1|nr:tRNA (adenine(22)-N(1))-methyltransferase TrmK [Robertmurraya korlensis]MCM3599551.1 tRNA (adenine(22)-N(1))-methyltransferase TrmK [Robertmurraya korlensis]